MPMMPYTMVAANGNQGVNRSERQAVEELLYQLRQEFRHPGPLDKEKKEMGT